MRVQLKNRMLLSLFFVILFFTLWTVLTKVVDPVFLPTLGSIGNAFKELFMKDGFLLDIIATIGRVMGGFLVSTIIGVPLGIWMATSEVVESSIGGLVKYLRFIPPSAYLALSIIWFGIGYTQKISIIFLGLFPFIALFAAKECRRVSKAQIEAGLTLGLSRKEVLRRIIIPSSLPGIWNALQVMLGAAWAVVIIAELVATQSGIGSMIINAQRFIQTPKVFAGIITIGFIGLFTDILFRYGYGKLFLWVENDRSKD